MNFLVMKEDEVRPSAESFLTFTALIGFIWAVKFLVLSQSRLWQKNFPHLLYWWCLSVAWTFRCWVSWEFWLKNPPHTVHSYGFSPVWTLVLNDSGVLTKMFPIFNALIRPFPTVNSLVQNESSLAKSLPTLTALISLCSSVNSLVYNKVGALAKELLLSLRS